jgi:hypothetical protein
MATERLEGAYESWPAPQLRWPSKGVPVIISHGPLKVVSSEFSLCPGMPSILNQTWPLLHPSVHTLASIGPIL